ncbi:tRNA (cytidine(32)/uridine(32)-2'-O)-methyltransferase [hydrothermal vent metagenome]|uniref:tRNA (Cytidine(32)/uridine(32)-2'-O)-methyltransferase n=1 Tax=hydrothermal vent metagenome TaxID=652676 RepID=A0A3B0YNG9_9ZZZZ
MFEIMDLDNTTNMNDDPSSDQCEPIDIILVETSHPGNIGATARAMKNMGLSNLVLVNPKDYPNVEATQRASGADDVLQRAIVKDTLREAVSNATLVVGASARFRRLAWPQWDAREAGINVIKHCRQQQGRVALVFGRENNGLSNEEMELCHYLVQIPTHVKYSSLNLSQAVQVVCYELRMACITSTETDSQTLDSPLAEHEVVEQMFDHIHEVLTDIDFINKDHPVKLLRRIRRMFHKAELEEKEVQIVRGIFAAVENKIRKNGQ